MTSSFDDRSIVGRFASASFSVAVTLIVNYNKGAASVERNFTMENFSTA